MALDQAAVLVALRGVVEGVADLAAVYDAASTDAYSIPSSLTDLPCAIIYPGNDIGYSMGNSISTHDYDVLIQVFEASMDTGERAASMQPFVQRIIGALTGKLKLGGVVPSLRYCAYRRSSGFVTLEYAGHEYLGYEITIECSEQAQVTIAP